MPGATVDVQHRVFTVSQSWLQTFMRCPQRALYELLDPKHGYNDATATGQAFHTYVELRLSGETHGSALRSAESWLSALVELDPTFRFVKVKTFGTMLAHLRACAVGWDSYVRPHVEFGGKIEEHYEAPLGSYEGWVIRLEGRPDYTEPSGRIWDWKSAGSEWNAYETVGWHIQPDAYTYLASTATGKTLTEFTFAVSIKPHGDVQFIDLVRTPEHWAWLARIAEGALALLRALPEGPWPVNHTHHLCSERWCPWWTGCRGAVLDTAAVPVSLNKEGTTVSYDDDGYEGEYEEGLHVVDDNSLDEYVPPEQRGPLPIGEVVTEDTMQGTVKLTRSMNLGTRDNNVHLGIELPFVVQPGWTWQQTAASAADAMFQAKALVYEQLGIEFTTNPNGVLMEVIRAQLPGTTTVEQGRGRPPSGQSRPGGGGGQPTRPRSFPRPADMERPSHIDQETWDSICHDPGAWWDNRADKAAGKVGPKYPDFRPKDGGDGVWLTALRRRA